MIPYKKYKDLPEGYISELHDYLFSNASEFFNNPDNKATDRRDFETWPDYPCDRTHLVEYGEIMLVDLETKECNHAYVICEVTKRKHRLSSGRVVTFKPLKSVLPIDDIRDKDWRAGYFLLPVFHAKQL